MDPPRLLRCVTLSCAESILLADASSRSNKASRNRVRASNDGGLAPVVGLGHFCVRFCVKFTRFYGLLKRYRINSVPAQTCSFVHSFLTQHSSKITGCNFAFPRAESILRHRPYTRFAIHPSVRKRSLDRRLAAFPRRAGNAFSSTIFQKPVFRTTHWTVSNAVKGLRIEKADLRGG